MFPAQQNPPTAAAGARLSKFEQEIREDPHVTQRVEESRQRVGTQRDLTREVYVAAGDGNRRRVNRLLGKLHALDLQLNAPGEQQLQIAIPLDREYAGRRRRGAPRIGKRDLVGVRNGDGVADDDDSSEISEVDRVLEELDLADNRDERDRETEERGDGRATYEGGGDDVDDGDEPVDYDVFAEEMGLYDEREAGDDTAILVQRTRNEERDIIYSNVNRALVDAIVGSINSMRLLPAPTSLSTVADYVLLTLTYSAQLQRRQYRQLFLLYPSVLVEELEQLEATSCDDVWARIRDSYVNELPLTPDVVDYVYADPDHLLSQLAFSISYPLGPLQSFYGVIDAYYAHIEQFQTRGPDGAPVFIAAYVTDLFGLDTDALRDETREARRVLQFPELLEPLDTRGLRIVSSAKRPEDPIADGFAGTGADVSINMDYLLFSVTAGLLIGLMRYSICQQEKQQRLRRCMQFGRLLEPLLALQAAVYQIVKKWVVQARLESGTTDLSIHLGDLFRYLRAETVDSSRFLSLVRDDAVSRFDLDPLRAYLWDSMCRAVLGNSAFDGFFYIPVYRSGMVPLPRLEEVAVLQFTTESEYALDDERWDINRLVGQRELYTLTKDVPLPAYPSYTSAQVAALVFTRELYRPTPVHEVPRASLARKTIYTLRLLHRIYVLLAEAATAGGSFLMAETSALVQPNQSAFLELGQALPGEDELAQDGQIAPVFAAVPDLEAEFADLTASARKSRLLAMLTQRFKALLFYTSTTMENPETGLQDFAVSIPAIRGTKDVSQRATAEWNEVPDSADNQDDTTASALGLYLLPYEEFRTARKTSGLYVERSDEPQQVLV